MEMFQKVQRTVQSKFRDFCHENFTDKIGEAIFKFFNNKDLKRNMFQNVTPESQQKIVFVKYLYDTYGLYNLLTGMDCFYRQVCLDKCSFETHGYSYIRQVITTPDYSMSKDWTEKTLPYNLSSRQKKEFDKEFSEFRKILEEYKYNQIQIESIICENFSNTNKIKKLPSSEKSIVNDQPSRVIPIQMEKYKNTAEHDFENYKYKCPVCNYINEEFDSFGCIACNILFDYKNYKK